MKPMFIEDRSKLGLDETVDLISEIGLESGWKVIQVLNLQETMRKNGKDVNPVKVMEMCKPEYAYEILSEDNLRIYSNMLPCRISVHENSDGVTYVSRMNIEMFSLQIGGVLQEVMDKAYAEVEEIIKKVTD